ncbi:serine recombinase [Pseudomonas sp. 09C 129]|uniref:recombinase family protein n=1 Tax=Pseudomonas sp. 09C 129 TaxID=2054915 RepID=UPI000C6EDDF1|nr:recombinase family protein [Pseudomonas sp. 09C 129]AUG01404.1 serine recombinase [Pseudomonas sp. 09C 129]
MDVVAYTRVSTGKQEKSGLGLEAQLDYIRKAAAQQGWNIVATYTETVSGSIKPEDRPEMSKALAHRMPIVTAKIDRISRDVEHMASLMKRVQLKIATMPTADNFQLHLFAALAEQERVFIRGRIKDALKALKQRADDGDLVSQGKIARRTAALVKARANTDTSAATDALTAKVEDHRKEIEPHVQACLYRGCTTLQSLADCLNEKRQLTSRGNQWTPTTVRRLMTSLQLSF